MIRDEFQNFRTWALQDRASPTVENYMRYLRQLHEFRPKDRAEEYTPRDLLEFIADMRARGLKPATICIAVSTLRQFFRFTVGDANPAAALRYPKVREEPQRTLTDDEAEQLLAVCDTSKAIGKRNLAMLSLMLDTGLRASEVCAVTLPNLNLEERSLTVQIKGGAVGLAVFSEYTRAALAEWLRVRNARRGVVTLFVSIHVGRGRQTEIPGKPLTRQGVRYVTRELCKLAGVEHASPHAMRRTFATLAIKSGAPSRVVQVAGRWADLRLVERYTKAIEAVDFEKYFPMNRLMSTGPKEQP